MLRFDHVGVVCDDVDVVAAFFLGLGFEREGATTVDGESVDKINGLDGVRADVMMMRTPDRTGRLELVKYHTPADTEGVHPCRRTGPAFATSRSRSMTSTRSSTDFETKASTPSARCATTETSIGSATSAVPKG
jgi:hypothetical protein